jgi:hypothetical protein
MTAYTDTAYVAWGIDYETGTEHDTRPTYWVGVWDDDGPQSIETTCHGRVDAIKTAKRVAKQTGLEMVELDEFGAVATK